MAVTLYILRQDGDPVLKFGPCRCTSDDEEKSLVTHVCNEIKKNPECSVKLNASYYFDKKGKRHNYIPGRQEFFYRGKEDNKKLYAYINRLRRYFWCNLFNIYVESPCGNRIIDFEFEYIDI
jgi:hypothetical protein